MTYLIAGLCMVQAVLAVVIMYFLTQVPSLTPRWPWAHSCHDIIERVIGAAISMAWLGYMILMIYICAALLLGELDPDMLIKMLAIGSLGLFLTFMLGTVILGHFAWIAWRADFQRHHS